MEATMCKEYTLDNLNAGLVAIPTEGHEANRREELKKHRFVLGKLSEPLLSTMPNKNNRATASTPGTAELFDDKDCSIYAKFVVSRIYDANWSYGRLANGGGSTTFLPERDYAEGSGSFLAYDQIQAVLAKSTVVKTESPSRVQIVRAFDLSTMSESEKPEPIFLGRVTLSADEDAIEVKRYPPFGRSSSRHCKLERIEFFKK